MLSRKIPHSLSHCQGYATTAASVKAPLLRSERRLARSQGKTAESLAKGRKFPLKTTKWNRPIAPGILPAYDQALAYILEDSRRLKVKVKSLESAIASETDATALAEMTTKLEALEVDSEINLPSSRWSVRNGVGMSLAYCP